jgi:hypothetical protein
MDEAGGVWVSRHTARAARRPAFKKCALWFSVSALK